MSEWRDIKDVPHDTNVIILLDKGVKAARYEPVYSYPWRCTDNECFTDEHVLGWIPHPKRPKKKHSCGCNPLWVEQSGENFVIFYYDHLGNRMNKIIRACPFCGEQAEGNAE